MTFDELRAWRPELGFAVYAYDPAGPVTFEVHFEGDVFTFIGASEEEAIAAAMGHTEQPDPQQEEDLFA